jgi:hypothetical protein
MLLHLLACVTIAAVPPLTDDQHLRLAGAVDGSDHAEDAFAALLENARQWTAGWGDVPVRLEADLDGLLAEPARFRGELCRLAGSLQQQNWLGSPHEDVVEWFVRDDAGRPILVYVTGLGPDHEFRDGRRIEIIARFYKRVDARGRDGRQRGYPAFVGVLTMHTGATAGTSGGWTAMLPLVIPVGVMLMVFVLLLVYVRRGGAARRTRSAVGAVVATPLAEPDSGLPTDPVEAMTELRRRSEVPDS